jgi:hypothetical protein
MKLITELFEAQVLYEGSEGNKKLYVEGIFVQQNIKNRNGRIYPGPLLEREVKRYTQEHISTGRAMGELGHPQGPGINLERVSHLVKECRQDGNNFIGKAQILDTPYGKIAESLIQSGVKLGVSSRGMGSLREDPKLGAKVVQDDFRLAVMIDLVADPSAPDAFVNGVMENVNWRMNELGEWVAEAFNSIQNTIHSTSKRDLAEVKVKMWEKFLTELRFSGEAEMMAARLGVEPAEAMRAIKMARGKASVREKAGALESSSDRDRFVYNYARELLGAKPKGS